MAGPYQILLPLLGLFLVRVDLTDLFPLHLKVNVLKIYDGDTVLVGHGSLQMKIRFDKIDSPEKGQPFIGGEGDAGLMSKNCLKNLLNSKNAHFAKIQKQDIYGRYLGDLDNASLRMIEAGCATLYPFSQFDSKKEKSFYLSALKKAKSSRRGLWGHGGFRQPKLWRKFSKRNGVPRSRP